MKKSLLVIAVILLGMNFSYSQFGVKVGVNAGLPVGDADEYTNFQLGADAAYLVDVAPLFQLGPLLGYSRFFSKDVDTGFGSMGIDDAQFLPVAASARLGIALVFVGADLGYAIGINDGNDGGFYYRPKVGINLVGLSLIASYSGISLSGGTFSSVNLGTEFGF